ncbi:MarR family transcriptional regulator [Actinokineospora auranticolor]|uniref:DNA-binding MarR family transcriptional regulator n=1 Tax=Actinokineospora auranticolor TaxID=155976 RepID=A0A2S6GPB6_9PSEU|nr:MarR family transcriptional regulator [Actinokineospora auranticolor]PPK67047.1 DNA-binding MarR family transcriptional regulator [Actinokineospora auranticolor]
MRAPDSSRLSAEIWRVLYDFVLVQHERHLAAAAEAGVSPGDLKTLVRLVPGEPQPMRALADQLHCDASTVTWIVDRLEKRGLVERRPVPTDRRVKAVVLSEAGERVRTELLTRINQPPAALAALSERDLVALREVAWKLR